jgi:hypothetical protein
LPSLGGRDGIDYRWTLDSAAGVKPDTSVSYTRSHCRLMLQPVACGRDLPTVVALTKQVGRRPLDRNDCAVLDAAELAEEAPASSGHLRCSGRTAALRSAPESPAGHCPGSQDAADRSPLQRERHGRRDNQPRPGRAGLRTSHVGCPVSAAGTARALTYGPVSDARQEAVFWY